MDKVESKERKLCMAVLHQGDITRDDLQQQFSAQHSAMLRECWDAALH